MTSLSSIINVLCPETRGLKTGHIPGDLPVLLINIVWNRNLESRGWRSRVLIPGDLPAWPLSFVNNVVFRNLESRGWKSHVLTITADLPGLYP
jgi:hypothetical protein